ncbi:hypothetical protein Vadar_034556 [Vaccinium darrowii]|uniref:Uncharacterized protein n=1 Tax=Vaccinium darrowii TaxID=229202 RepID=A0ACB7XWT1_9ERIC|nr:hypothetical protein Vadar_034556 [Vaccinium darrowii]
MSCGNEHFKDRKMEGGKISLLGFLVSLVFTRVVGGAGVKGLASCNFPAVYNFGDSNSDTGAGLSATIRPTQPPKGRICDGRLVIDFIGKNTSGLPRPEDFSKALYTLDIGQNDCYQALFGYPTPVIPDLINNFTAALQSLYDEGGRAFWIHNVGPNGCLPFIRRKILGQKQETLDKNGCVNSLNEIVMEYNKQLKDRVIKLRADLPDASITYVDVYTVKYNLISNAKSLGFTGPFTQCIYNTTCENPSMHISWDGVHYTEAANHIVAKDILNGSLSDPPVSITHACHKSVSSYLS